MKPSGLALTANRRLSQVSDRARQLAALILDVLGGNRRPGDAAKALGLSVARYYVIEQRAVLGLVDACEAQPRRGPQPDLTRQIRSLEKENRHLNQAVLRQQAIVRSTQRGLGISSPKPPPTPAPGAAKGKTRRPRRPSVRALRQARRVAPTPSTTAPGQDRSPGDQRGG